LRASDGEEVLREPFEYEALHSSDGKGKAEKEARD
jgi:hypothetical protein